MAPQPPDIIIAGAGPVGTALAAGLVSRGVGVQVIDPAPDQAWPNRYGCWSRDWEKTRFADHVAYRWPTAAADLGKGPVGLGGEYLAIDRASLRQQLRHECGPTHFIADRVVGVAHPNGACEVELASGQRISASMVVDATGRGDLISRSKAPRAFQAAFGLHVRVRNSVWSPARATIMDLSVDHLDGGGRSGPSSFLYALPIAPDEVFVEETSLVAAPAIPFDLLEQRLHQRLAHRGVEVVEVIDQERCLIPMDLSIPRRGKVLAVGSSAGWVHPATGYQFARAMAQIEQVADAISSGLDHSPARALNRAWNAVWPASHRRTRALHEVGLGLLLTFTAEETRRFFEAFYRLPHADQCAYLDATASPGAVARAMARVFSSLPSDLSARVVGHAIGQGRGPLVRALVPKFRGVK